MMVDGEQDGDGSFKRQVSSTARTLMSFVHIRTQLFALEVKEASQELSGKAIYIAAGAVLLFFGYSLFLVGLVVWIHDKWELRWEGICLTLAALHIAGGAFLLWLAKDRFSKPIFEATLNELEKDREWLARNAPPSNDKRRN